MRELQANRKAATIPESGVQVHRSSDLESLFHDVFFADYHTLLVGGAAEPLYQAGSPHRIFYTHDYFRSALHEVAHWCVAGEARRKQDDYGYWYAPDGRDAQQQASFMEVEVLPQALELLFCDACGVPFRVSLDNLNGDAGDESVFAQRVAKQAATLRASGLAQRPARWCDALRSLYRP